MAADTPRPGPELDDLPDTDADEFTAWSDGLPDDGPPDWPADDIVYEARRQR